MLTVRLLGVAMAAVILALFATHRGDPVLVGPLVPALLAAVLLMMAAVRPARRPRARKFLAGCVLTLAVSAALSATLLGRVGAIVPLSFLATVAAGSALLGAWAVRLSRRSARGRLFDNYIVDYRTGR